MPLKEAINKAPAEQMIDAQVEDIKAAKEKLMNSAHRLFARFMSRLSPGRSWSTGSGRSAGAGQQRQTPGWI